MKIKEAIENSKPVVCEKCGKKSDDLKKLLDKDDVRKLLCKECRKKIGFN